MLDDGVDPPLGFREIQFAKLIGWQGSKEDEEFRRLVGEIAAKVHAAGKKRRPARAKQIPQAAFINEVTSKDYAAAQTGIPLLQQLILPMILDVDNTLENLLKGELPTNIGDAVQISFERPDDQFPPPSVNLPAISAFLYDIQQIYNGTEVIPSVEYYYLITSWPSPIVFAPVMDEHLLLGEVINIFNRHKTIPAKYLDGELKRKDALWSPVMLRPSRIQSVWDMWQALGVRPKLALSYIVTINSQDTTRGSFTSAR